MFGADLALDKRNLTDRLASRLQRKAFNNCKI